MRKEVINMNIVLQRYGSGLYNVWEDVELTHNDEYTPGLAGLYRVHKYHDKIYDRERKYCNWSYNDLYLVKEIYGGFVEGIQKGTY